MDHDRIEGSPVSFAGLLSTFLSFFDAVARSDADIAPRPPDVGFEGVDFAELPFSAF